MNKSRYVVQVGARDGGYLLYNVANGAFVELDEAMRQAWEDGSAEDADAGEMQGQAVAELVRLGFLTSLDAGEELVRQQSAFDEARSDATGLTLSFIPTYACNFRCPYCYEIGHNKIQGKMDDRTVDAIMEFVAFKYDQDRFRTLSVQWYGGDPSLALDRVETLSQRLISWCEERGVAYDALMLTNANVIDEPEADLIARCRISQALLTIDGPEELHNRRRVAANGSNSYERTIRAARLFRERGISVSANMNGDKVNWPLYADLRTKLFEEEGIALSMTKLNDYGHFFGEGPFSSPDFDLFAHEEYVQAQFDEFAKAPHAAYELRDMLRPIRRFCTGQLDNYFVIDLLGDVYNCDGWVGDKSHVRFNLFDERSTWKLHEVSFDATRDNKCSACELLPVCLGNCIWERSLSGMPCHPFKHTIGDYLNLYYDCLRAEMEAESSDGVTVLAEPLQADELGW